jgi:ATP synthase F1 gamma subunit
MQNKQRINSEVELMSTLRLITQAYEEISVMRMQRIRDLVLNTRLFLGDLYNVYVDVKVNYKESLMKKIIKEDDAMKAMRERNGKTAVVFISTNTKLNGEIIQKVFREFYDYTQAHDVEIFIVGRMGKQLYDQRSEKKPYKYYDLEENYINSVSLHKLVTDLLAYKQVDAFYGKFESLLNQIPTEANLTGDQPEEKQAEKKGATLYMFEPSVVKILEFFETQIFSSLVKQSVNESELARYASRIRAMEEAGQNIDKSMKSLSSQMIKIKRLVSNKKQLEIMSRVILSK